MTQPSAAAPSDGASPNAPGAGEGDRLRTTRLFLLAAGLFVFLTADGVPGDEAPDGGFGFAGVARHVGHRADGVHLGGEEHEQACGEQEQTRRA